MFVKSFRVRDIMLDQIRHVETNPVPYNFWYEEGIGASLDAYYGSASWRDSIVAFHSTPLVVDTLQEKRLDPIRVKDGFGGIWRVDRKPWHLETPPMGSRSFADYSFPAAGGFVDPVVERISDAKDKIAAAPDSFHVIGMGWGLFEQTWRIRGFENALMDSVEDPRFYHGLMERLTDLYLAMIRACADVPADAFFFGDDWGEQRGVILGPDRWRELIKPYWKIIYEEVHRQGKFVISHCCGSVADIMPDLIEIGLDVLESVQPEARGMEPYALKREWGEHMVFWGCLGNQSLIPFGTPETLRREIRNLRKKMGEGGGFILAPAKPIQAETPIENVVAILEAFLEFDTP